MVGWESGALPCLHHQPFWLQLQVPRVSIKKYFDQDQWLHQIRHFRQALKYGQRHQQLWLQRDKRRLKQRNWDSGIIMAALTSHTSKVTDAVSRARFLAAQSAHAGDWLLAPPIAAVGLRLSNEAIRVAVGMRLGFNLCEPHQCQCGAVVDARGLHGLSCRRSAGRQQRHSLLNDLVFRSLRRAQVQASEEPLGLLKLDGKRTDGVTLIPWSRGRCLTWDVTVPDTFAASHLPATSLTAGAAAEKAASLNTNKYEDLQTTHLFVPIAIETSSCFNQTGLEFITELGNRLKHVTGDKLKLTYLYQRLSIAIQRGNELCFNGTFVPR